MRSVRISDKTARDLLAFLDSPGLEDMVGIPLAAIEHLRSASKVKPAVRAARKVREAKKADHREETSAIYRAVMERAAGRCEACGQPEQRLDRLELEHQFGRVRQRQSPETTWAVHQSCHKAKQANRPSRAYWLRIFVAHCERYGFLGSLRMASGELAKVETKDHFRGAP